MYIYKHTQTHTHTYIYIYDTYINIYIYIYYIAGKLMIEMVYLKNRMKSNKVLINFSGLLETLF